MSKRNRTSRRRTTKTQPPAFFKLKSNMTVWGFVFEHISIPASDEEAVSEEISINNLVGIIEDADKAAGVDTFEDGTGKGFYKVHKTADGMDEGTISDLLKESDAGRFILWALTKKSKDIALALPPKVLFVDWIAHVEDPLTFPPQDTPYMLPAWDDQYAEYAGWEGGMYQPGYAGDFEHQGATVCMVCHEAFTHPEKLSEFDVRSIARGHVMKACEKQEKVIDWLELVRYGMVPNPQTRLFDIVRNTGCFDGLCAKCMCEQILMMDQMQVQELLISEHGGIY